MSDKSGVTIPPRFLYSFAFPLRRNDESDVHRCAVSLGEAYRLPYLPRLDQGTRFAEREFAEVRAAWSPAGLAFSVEVSGKTQALWCRETRMMESDGLQIWVDTRATLNVHRASRFCHRFVFLPAGGGRDGSSPIAEQLLISRARENARPIRPRELQVESDVRDDGYSLRAFAPAISLGGFDPGQHDQLGYTHMVFDRELGIQTFSSGTTFRFDEDPSCWSMLDLKN